MLRALDDRNPRVAQTGSWICQPAAQDARVRSATDVIGDQRDQSLRVDPLAVDDLGPILRVRFAERGAGLTAFFLGVFF